MKKLPVLLLAIVMVFSCKQEKSAKQVSSKVETVETETAQLEPISDSIMETAVIYEANIRQYSPEGTFDAFTKDIPQLKQLGVKVIWLMPVFPISETKRKATGGENSKFASDFPEEEQSKYLGSYYAVSDFTKINPEFGTIEDFRELVAQAHENGIYVILDWVPNHTGWDHTWIKNHPDYYTQNEAGEIIHPKDTDWTDVADLNYDNQDMRKEMIADMEYWITNENIDGFRCDVAGSVPTDFWEQAIPELRKQKDIFMLAEAWEPELLKGNLFDMAYAWDGHHLLNSLAKQEKSLKDFKTYIDKVSNDYEANDILMNFVTNHDENSWNGTVKERMGKASEVMTALTYVLPGMPLIYSGQEYDLDHRLKFFEKDSFPKNKGNTWKLLEQLGVLKQTNDAINGGKNPASFKILETSNVNILKIEREKNGKKLVFIANISDAVQTEKNTLVGTFLDYMADKTVDFKADETIALQPWEYKILIK
ncbi:Glycosidase [Bizionia echini]|uniref:Glycosidase n=1 Tax=Bizionia echini TaxID=649333 RepID=A0A1I4YPB4_9FLAO|nr:alpha-amylase family glycosyl hydrolase [Bizionia echini]SFN39479.1 Glycosidase [Bizionia echini]